MATPPADDCQGDCLDDAAAAPPARPVRWWPGHLAWAVLPLAGLLWAQWPLRELVHAGSQRANDLGQLVFAVYAAVAVTAASRAGTHLAAGRRGVWRPRTRATVLALCVLPWAGWTLWAAAPTVWQSLAQQERFPETLTPGYFVIRLAMVLLLLLAMAQAVAELWRAWRRPAC